MPSINFADVKGLEPVPVGTYLATITHAEEGLSKSDNPKIDLRWKLEEPPYEGRIVFDVMTFHPKALFRVKATLTALGWPKNHSGNVEAADLLGKTAMIIVDIEQQTQLDEDGEPYPARNRVKKVKPVAQQSRRGSRR